MNEREIKTRFPNASSGFIRANLRPSDIGETSKLESDIGNEPLEKKKVQGSTGERLLVRVTSIRRRLLDEDNLCEKYHVDLCRYAQILPCDTPDKIKIEVCQRKPSDGEGEQIVIEIFKRANQKDRLVEE